MKLARCVNVLDVRTFTRECSGCVTGERNQGVQDVCLELTAKTVMRFLSWRPELSKSSLNCGPPS